MCGSMVEIQSVAAEIRRGKKKEEERRKKIEITGQKYNGPLLHRAAITTWQKYNGPLLHRAAIKKQDENIYGLPIT